MKFQVFWLCDYFFQNLKDQVEKLLIERNLLQSQLDQFRENNEVGLNSRDQTDAIKEQTLEESENVDEVRWRTRESHKVKLYANSELCVSQLEIIIATISSRSYVGGECLGLENAFGSAKCIQYFLNFLFNRWLWMPLQSTTFLFACTYILTVETVMHTYVDEGIWFGLSCCLYWVLLAFPLQASAVWDSFLRNIMWMNTKLIKIRVLFDCKLKSICPTILDTFTLPNNMTVTLPVILGDEKVS